MNLTKEWVNSNLPKRPANSHKGTFGKVLSVAGSRAYPGAAYLACAACYRVGAGLVALAADPMVEVIVSRRLPEVTFLSLNEVIERKDKYDVLLLGPGLGQKPTAVKLLKHLFEGSVCKMVIDGDGLNILSKVNSWWERLDGACVLTPHPGEMARLTGLSVDEIQKNREQVVVDYARKWGQVVVLKGASTVIASPCGEVLKSLFANPVLATAGTGDVLAGAIAGIIAQQVAPYAAAGVGVYLHGEAGEMLRKKIGDAGVLASDILPLLPLVIKNLI
ncbi:MAG: carbohydrate kinase [uncultured bacterium]|uniref:ADP-dependent (S)-NAD(P)H-hydrate dehydratase n=1 Tax=Candidatus Daviesbacteria bacterium GW2011_GWC2_40_12 TaxID=1618431 RepID=A0A0G0T606_9BACT|nr:MAG: carbohydrate kinase [uncultured bacterium]KKQ85060.1 MAG: Carbohydrate kinase family protein [Candidatus Daviesbacteria bacterium GW2011_GWF2_38_7]KKR17181.1 MAG: Carbohydrate kinase family protein [Candidatus Daviesbacteria bacterium GW2011_GWA2_39_33]KKR24802.1 MAG: Carbohydrate kinase family protein [Candidatus Daviesbacteria bacterium GW2011_GWB1_39_5]KKR42580.1 MAG: Carbohydrate kinase family protein [Candidatus Daviesbacteria bacterium GW2011_GWC2_40_12]OGE21256.1 MAG: NAD(P)H-hy